MYNYEDREILECNVVLDTNIGDLVPCLTSKDFDIPILIIQPQLIFLISVPNYKTTQPLLLA